MTRPEIDMLLRSLASTRIPVIDLSLGRMQHALEMLGNPQEKLPPVVHVAGTNGKGSLLAYLRAILQAAGYRVHRYTSPHLVRFNERIVLAGNEIADEQLHPLLLRVASLCEKQPLTMFEATTALAFLAYSEVKADILLLETGLGGRLDATNVLPAPLLTAITPISMDHMDFLGNTLEAIAAEKAGIIKRGVPCVVGPQQAAASGVIERTANDMGAPLALYGRDWAITEGAQGMCFTRGGRDVSYPLPNLAGRHQLYNAGTAIACVPYLTGFTITDEHIAHGIRHADWPARLQHLREGALAELLPQGAELWLDGGHNEGAGMELADWLRKQRKPVHGICGMLSTKDASGFLRPMAPFLQSLTSIPIEGEPLSQSPEAICRAAQGAGIRNVEKNNIKSAIEHIVKNNSSDIIILVCGSLLLAGNTLWQNGTKPQKPEYSS